MATTPDITFLGENLPKTDINSATLTISSLYIPKNTLALLTVFGRSATTMNDVTASSAGRTWTYVGGRTSDNYDGGYSAVLVFRSTLATDDENTTITVTKASGSFVRAGAQVVAINHVDLGGTNGSNAVVQTATAGTDSTTNTAPQITLSAFGSASNGTFAAHLANNATGPIQQDNTWTHYNGSVSTFSTYYMQVSSGFLAGADTTVNATSVGNNITTATAWSAFACELKFAENTALPSGKNATGGTISTDGEFTVHAFTSNGSFVVPSHAQPAYAQVLAVGGGGAGGYDAGGGGGAGELVHKHIKLSPGSYSIVIGSGGTASSSPTAGGSTTGLGLTAVGGGEGGNGGADPGGAGGSGGGAGYTGSTSGGASTASQGYGHVGGNAASINYRGGGGGGAAYKGLNANVSNGGGGNGLRRDVSSVKDIWRAGGAGAGGVNTASGVGGWGGGGNGGSNGVSGTAASVNSGSGGGGGGLGPTYTAGNGGTGVVIIRYRTGAFYSASGGFFAFM
jgi:hypothetical protein